MLKKLVLAFLVFLLLVVVHHLYGGYVLYGDSLELKLSYVAVGAALPTLLLLWLYTRQRSNAVLSLCQFLIIGGWGFGVGVYDGGYNHLVLNVLALNGASTTLLEAMFVRPVPGDFIFEATGLLQFVLAIPLVAYMLRVADEDRALKKEQQRQGFIQQERKQPPGEKKRKSKEKQEPDKETSIPAESE